MSEKKSGFWAGIAAAVLGGLCILGSVAGLQQNPPENAKTFLIALFFFGGLAIFVGLYLIYKSIMESSPSGIMSKRGS